jgi:hypothetical protein
MKSTQLAAEDFAMGNAEGLWEIIESWSSRSDLLLLKKLSRNDTSWSMPGGGHQAGFYVPRDVRESGFFPPLIAREDKPHIFQTSCPSIWPQTGELKSSMMRHFSNKGSETHITVVPHDVFQHLNPASLLLCGRLRKPIGGSSYWFVVIDSHSDDAEMLETALEISSDFHCAIFPASKLLKANQLEKDEEGLLIEELQRAIKGGTLEEFIASVSRLPSPAKLAEEAQKTYLAEHGLTSLDPFSIERPGDAIMYISRDIEFRIFRGYELRKRAAEIVGVLAKENDLSCAVVRGFSGMDSIFLSASQQRKTRAGRSFENHLAALLKHGKVRFEEQAILGGRRPDFVLPSRKVVRAAAKGNSADAAILSAKTTLRERWKQIKREDFGCHIFLATVDDRVSPQALDEMQDSGIKLVVPESLKKANDTTCYGAHANVISFRDFFDEELSRKRPSLISRIGHPHPVRSGTSSLF